MAYQLLADGSFVRRLSDGAQIPADPLNRNYQEYLAWVADGNTAQPADPEPEPEPEPEPSLDERLLAAVDSAKTAVTASKSFTAEQAAVLAAVFDGLGKAITGEAP